MSWPEAFTIVGVVWAVAFALFALSRTIRDIPLATHSKPNKPAPPTEMYHYSKTEKKVK